MSKLTLKVKTVFEPERHTVIATMTHDIYEDIKAILKEHFEIEMLTTAQTKIRNGKYKISFDTTEERATKIRHALTNAYFNQHIGNQQN